jgi:hypothetical protein
LSFPLFYSQFYYPRCNLFVIRYYSLSLRLITCTHFVSIHPPLMPSKLPC